MRDDGEEQQHGGGEEEGEGEGGDGGDVIGRAEGRLAGKSDEGEECEGKSDEGGKWRIREKGESEKEEEPLTLDLTVTSPGEQPSPNPGAIFCIIQIFIKIEKSRFSRQSQSSPQSSSILLLQGSLPALAA